MDRRQLHHILSDLETKMVLLTGPRQVGKTWLCKEAMKHVERAVYLNYDAAEDRRIIRGEGWLPNTELLVLDELHKMPGWKNYLKGVYDTKPSHLRILVTGSARLDTFGHSGDSLAGRFFRHRLMPLSLAELPNAQVTDVDRLIERGGFPEPFLAKTTRDAQRWRLQYAHGLIRTDVLDFESVYDLRSFQLVFDLLRRRVGAPVSYSAIARDVEISPNTVKRYIQILEALFICFRVTPYARNIARSLLKEPKIYFYDTGLVEGDKGAKLENFVAISLLKHLYNQEDYEGLSSTLHYLRTKDGQEVDFCLVTNDAPVAMVEVKSSGPELVPTLVKFHAKHGIPAVQVVQQLRLERLERGIQVRRVFDYLRELSL